jgi:adenine-specific DNA-methyltransferase
MDGKSLDILSDKLNKLKELIPGAFTEGEIDWEKLKLTLGDDLNLSEERYHINWAGKSEVFRILQQRTAATLIPNKNESVNFDETENVFIEGENLEVLKVLQKSYFGKIKMIYIDLPYNTGNDSFIYPDRFSETKNEYLKRIGDKDEEGYLLKEGMYRKNSKDAGHYHSNWLTMMYPRLYLARNLLRDNGVIFVSIDDNEVHNLRLIMNEIFGEENFLSQIIVRANSRGQTYKQIAKTHEYILIYTRNFESELYELEKDELSNDLNMEDDVSSYNLRELRNRNPKFGKHNRPNLYYPIYVNPESYDQDGHHPISLEKTKEYKVEVFPLNSEGKESCWRWSKVKLSENFLAETLKSNIIARKKGNGTFGIFEKYRKTTYKPKSIWEDNSFLTETGTMEFRELGLEGLFDFPKPVSLVKQNVELSTNSEDEDMILDFFAGSGTTAQAVMELNNEDGGNRKFILVQLPEKTKEDSEAYKAGYKTIADICKERIRRVIEKLKQNSKVKSQKKGQEELKLEHSEESNNEQNVDLGFKVFKFTNSNFKIWRSDLVETEEDLNKMVDIFDTQVKEGSKEENMLYELMLKSGYKLTDKVDKKNGYYSIANSEIVIVLEKVEQNQIEEILKLKPKNCIMLDNLFAGNDQLKTNTALQFKDANIELVTV